MTNIDGAIPMREICEELGIPFSDEFRVSNVHVFWDFMDQAFFVYVLGAKVATFTKNEAEESGRGYEVLQTVLRNLRDAASAVGLSCRVLTWPLWFDAEVSQWKETDHVEATVFLRRRIRDLDNDWKLTNKSNHQHIEWIERRRDTLRSELEMLERDE